MDDGAPTRPEVWRPGVDGMDADEELEYDPTVYDCLHAWSLEWPCLSFDVMRDELGENRQNFPHSMFMVAGTQAERAEQNTLSVMRLTRLKKTRRKEKESNNDPDDSEASESESSDDDDDGPMGKPGGDGPLLQVRKIAHHGAVNRVRCMPQRSSICATWSDSGTVQIWDTSKQLNDLMSMVDDAEEEGHKNNSNAKGLHQQAQRVAPRFAFTGHKDEGYALDWSPTVNGRLLTGDNNGVVHLFEPKQGGTWAVDGSNGFSNGHGQNNSVEDLQWSPSETDVFASCGSDGRVCVWDTRQRGKPAISVKAHSTDVNVMSWNRQVNYMLATGADDGGLRIWDLRSFSGAGNEDTKFVANFTFHRAPVTSIEWARFDGAMLASSSADHTVCVWDLAVERDAEEEAAAMASGDNAIAPEELPPQLMVVHQGLKDPKEIHWHHQIPGMCLTTAADGFNAFKAYNVGNEVV